MSNWCQIKCALVECYLSRIIFDRNGEMGAYNDATSSPVEGYFRDHFSHPNFPVDPDILLLWKRRPMLHFLLLLTWQFASSNFIWTGLPKPYIFLEQTKFPFLASCLQHIQMCCDVISYRFGTDCIESIDAVYYRWCNCIFLFLMT